MTRKIYVVVSTALLIAAAFALVAMAQGVKTFAVQPFNYMGPEKYQHYGKSIRSVLRSKLNSPGVFEPAPESQAQMLGTTAPASTAEGVSKLNAADVDYLVNGMVSMAGNTATIEINALGKSGNLVTRSAEVPHDQLSLELDRLAKSITRELFNIGSDPNKPKTLEERPANPAFLTAQATEQTPSSAINPEFRYEGGSRNQGRRQSQGLRFASRGMTVCDADGDGKNEIFILDKYKVHVYSFEQGKLVEKGEMRFPNRNDPLHITSIDSNRDGRAEILITTLDEAPNAYVYEYSGGNFTPKVERSPYFLNVIDMPPNYTPTLVAQRLSHLGGFRSTDAKEAYISKGKIVTGRHIPLPQFGNIYNIAYLPEGDTHKLILLDRFNRLKVFTKENAPDSSSEQSYNSSAVPISLGAAVVPGLESNRNVMDEQYYYLPIGMKVTNIFSQGDKYEVLMNKDVSIASQVFARFKSFTQGEIHSMYWDGTGLNLAWKTRRIKGTVVSYDICDADNDGKLDLAVLVNTYPGAIAVSNIKTVLLVYDLKF